MTQLMRERGMRVRHQWRDTVTMDLTHGLAVADNLRRQTFTPTALNPVWTSHITDLWTDESGHYSAIGMELFNREIVGRS